MNVTSGVSNSRMGVATTDKERLDFLDRISHGGNMVKIIARWSTSGRGWRLHEATEHEIKHVCGRLGKRTVREAIDDFMRANNNAKKGIG